MIFDIIRYIHNRHAEFLCVLIAFIRTAIITPDTPVRKTRRKYEEKNKEKRKQASGNFGTMIPRALYDEINAFLDENGITKVRLIKEGYEALKTMKKDGKL